RLRDHRVGMIGISAAALALTVLLFAVLPMQFFPDTNSDFVGVKVELVPGTTLDQTAAASAEVTAILRRRPEVESVLERFQEGSSRMFVVLKKH
ncbi:efflux RND transporter permease subunit, partial [Acinetobacter baumannii]